MSHFTKMKMKWNQITLPARRVISPFGYCFFLIYFSLMTTWLLLIVFPRGRKHYFKWLMYTSVENQYLLPYSANKSKLSKVFSLAFHVSGRMFSNLMEIRLSIERMDNCTCDAIQILVFSIEISDLIMVVSMNFPSGKLHENSTASAIIAEMDVIGVCINKCWITSWQRVFPV